MSATAILTGSSMGLNVLEGVFAKSAADAQAQSMRDQISLVRAESEADIARYAENTKEFKTKQAMAYMKSGVSLEGSPLDILDETIRVSGENINAMRAKTNAEIQGIKGKATATEGQGRAALVAGFGRAANNALTTWGKLDGSAVPKRTTETSSSPTKAAGLGFGIRGKLDLGF